MTATVALARAELVMLARNRTAAITAVLLPLGMGLLLLFGQPPAGFVPTAAALQLLVVIGMTVIGTATTTLVARRQQHVLQRWRTSEVATPAVLLGTLAPFAVLLAGQATVLFAATAYATGSTPEHPALLALATALGGAVACAMAFVTAAFTRNVEAANITPIPSLVALLGGGFWAMSADPGEASWAMLATGGGALAELVRLGWAGPSAGAAGSPLAAAGPSVLALAALTTVAVTVALRTFRWESRG